MNVVAARYIGFCCTLVGVGFARMAFTPLTASAIYEGLIPASTTTAVGAILMITYALGACFSGGLLRRIGAVKLIKGSLALALFCQLLELFAPDINLWLLTRGLYGFAGGCLMVAGPVIAVSVGNPTQLSKTPLWTFVGVGAGAFTAATLLQLPVNLSIQQNLLFVIVTAIVVSVWWLFKQSPEHDVVPPHPKSQPRSYVVWPVATLLFAYMFDALGYVPATIYLSDYAANQLMLGRDVGNTLWQCFGVGAIFSMPLLAMVNLKRFATPTIICVYGLKTLALYLMSVTADFYLLAVSALITGAAVPAIVLLTATLLRQWVSASEFPLLWQKATAAFAIGQAISALAMAQVFLRITDYQPLFLSGALLMAIATLLALSLASFAMQRRKLHKQETSLGESS